MRMPMQPERRSAVRLSLVGFSSRDEIVFKSVTQVLRHRLHHSWSIDEKEPDLRVISESASGPDPYELRESESGSAYLLCIATPIHALRLEESLNNAGHVIVARQSLELAAPSRVQEGDLLQLKRWPPASLTAGEPRSLRLATLLTTRARTLTELQRISGIDVQTCRHFCDGALAVGALEIKPFPMRQVSDTRTQGGSRGLFALIRAKLGLQGLRE